MTNPIDETQRRQLLRAFRMPSVATMVSRKSSITNAFVGSVIPAIPPTLDEIAQALAILGQDPLDVRCAYCGERSTEWDHLRPLVVNRRPTGFITEIANLVPACGKCNQSKGNKPWRDWMRGSAQWSPCRRSPKGIEERFSRLEAYEVKYAPTKVDFESIIGSDEWAKYWELCEEVNNRLRECQEVADRMRQRISKQFTRNDSDPC